MEQWSSIINQHVSRFESSDGKLFDKVRQHFLGNPWAQTTAGESESLLLKTSTNFVFPIVETATSVLIPPNPQVTAKPRSRLEAEAITAAEGVVNWSFDAGQWRDELTVVVQNTVMYGRGPVKTVFDAARDMPITKFLDPRNYFFDMTAHRFDDVRYEMEATILSRGDMKKRVEEGLYKPAALERLGTEKYPKWLIPQGKDDLERLRNFQPWYLVWEVYDRESNRVMHFLPSETTPIFEDEILYRPYDLLTFNFNGDNVGGVSEIGLILPNQEEYNWTETFLLNILRFGVPRMLEDAKVSSSDQSQKRQMAPLGSRVPVEVPANKNLSDLFFNEPMPQYPPLANDMLAKKREGISFVSALTDAQRAQTIGAKTATELAFIEGNIKNRLRPRQSKVDALTERVAEKHLLLASRYMQKEKVFRVSGSEEWSTIDPWTIDGVESAFKMVPYSPMESNKAVKIETLRNMQPMIVGNPHVDQRRFTEMLFEYLEMPRDLILPLEQVAAAAAPPGEPPAGAEIAPPGVAPTPGAGDTTSALPPRAANFSEAVSTAP